MGRTQFTINFADPSRSTYYSGDTIAGTVILVSDTEVSTDEVNILFSGLVRSKIVYGNGRSYSERTTWGSKIWLFRHTQCVFKGPYTLRANTYTWPFEFTVPWECSEASGELFDGKDDYNCDLRQRLPPTSALGDGEGFYYGKCEVSYELNATVVATRVFKFDTTAKSVIHIAALREHEYPDHAIVPILQQISCRSYQLDPTHSQKLTFREKMKQTVGLGEMPTAIFKVSVPLPRSAFQGQDIPLRFTITRDSVSSSASAIPLVKLLSAEVILQTSTTIRGHRNCQYTIDYDPSKPTHRTWDDDAIILAKFTEPMVLSTNEVDLSPYLKPVIPLTITPSFRTWSIVHHHTLQIKVRLEIAGEKEKATFEVPGFTVEPEQWRPYLAGVESWSKNDAPPGYDEDVKQQRVITDTKGSEESHSDWKGTGSQPGQPASWEMGSSAEAEKARLKQSGY